MTPKLIVEQKITAFVNQYAIFAATPSGDKADLVAYAQQKRLAFKEKVTFYNDTAKTQPIFTFRAEKLFDYHGRFIVEDASGQALGSFKKEFGKSLVASTWTLRDKEGNVRMTASETNQTLAVLRRYAGYVPIIGDIFDLVLIFFKYHFTFHTNDNQAVGMYKKTTLLRDHYMLLMDNATYELEDWRVLASLAVALDALQGR